jgi:hypothetical protein
VQQESLAGTSFTVEQHDLRLGRTCPVERTAQCPDFRFATDQL